MRSSILVASLFYAAISLTGSIGHAAWALQCSKNGVNFFIADNANGTFMLSAYVDRVWSRVITKMKHLPRSEVYIGRVDSPNSLEKKGFKLWHRVSIRTHGQTATIQVWDENALESDRPAAEYRDLACKVFSGSEKERRSHWEPR